VKKRWNLILIFLLALSLLLNVVLIQKYYQQYIRLRTERSVFYYRPTPMTHSDQTYILFLGDSRIQQWKPLPDFQGAEILNLGCAGATSSELVEQMERMEYPKHIRLAVIEIGINDLTVIGLTPQRKDLIVSECKSNITRSIEILRQKNIPVFLLPVFPAGKIGWLRSFVWSKEIDNAVRDVNQHLLSLKAEGVILTDCSEMIGTNGRIREEYARDALHLNSQGYQRLDDIVVSLINDLLPKKEF
jgi:lysophospholipase L1-like esterase